MTPEAQRIAIAKACGWTFLKNRIKYQYYNTVTKEYALDWPDYLNDLNALHDAWEKKIAFKHEVPGRFRNELRKKCCRERGLFGEWDAVNATAAQRAEAFLRTLNLWDDTK